MPEPLDLDMIEKRCEDSWIRSINSHVIYDDVPALVARVRELEKDVELDELNAEEFETALIKKTERVLELEGNAKELAEYMLNLFPERHKDGIPEDGVSTVGLTKEMPDKYVSYAYGKLEAEVESLKNDAKGCEDHCRLLQDRLDARDRSEKRQKEAGIAYDDLPPINITGDLSAQEHIQRLRDGE